MDEFDFLNDQNKEKPTMFVEFFKKELKEREEKEKFLEEKAEKANEPKILNKFKDQSALISAYERLEANYTKKCQQLAQMRRELQGKQLKKETVLKTSSNQEKCKFAENQNGGYSRTKVLASKPRDREI